MPTIEARLARLERRVEGIESRFNGVLEAVTGHWATLPDEVKGDIERATRGVPGEDKGAKRPE